MEHILNGGEKNRSKNGSLMFRKFERGGKRWRCGRQGLWTARVREAVVPDCKYPSESQFARTFGINNIKTIVPDGGGVVWFFAPYLTGPSVKRRT